MKIEFSADKIYYNLSQERKNKRESKAYKYVKFPISG